MPRQTHTHYHVWNQEGPEPVANATSFRDAKRAAAKEARVWRHDIGCYVTGSAANGYTISWEKDSMGAWSLWIADCGNPDCPDHPNREEE